MIPGCYMLVTLPTTRHTDTYEDLVHYFKYASSTYIVLCPRPNGNTLVMNVRGGLDVPGHTPILHDHPSSQTL